MISVDSDALGIVTRSLGLTGRGAQVTEFLDGQVQQVLDVAPLVRRGRTQTDTGGIYTGTMQTVHTDAETITFTVNPFDVTTGRVSPYPGPITNRFDLWVISVSVRRVSGGGTLTAQANLAYSAAQIGWGIDDSGVAVTSNAGGSVAFWDSIAVQSNAFGLQNGSNPTQFIGQRLFPGTVLQVSATSSLTSTYNFIWLLGVFPIALGQDIQT